MAAAANRQDRAVDPRGLQVVGTSDSELLCREAFETLYRRYARPVFGLALRHLHDHGRAEDAVQEAFTAVWRSAPTYRWGR